MAKTRLKKSGMELGLEWLSEQLGRKVEAAEVLGAAMSIKLADEATPSPADSKGGTGKKPSQSTPAGGQKVGIPGRADKVKP